MLDIQGRSASAPASALEFLRVDLSPLSDGSVFVALTATTLDPNEPQLLDEEVVSENITSIDQLMKLLQMHVRITAQPATHPPLN